MRGTGAIFEASGEPDPSAAAIKRNDWESQTSFASQQYWSAVAIRDILSFPSGERPPGPGEVAMTKVDEICNRCCGMLCLIGSAWVVYMLI